MSVLMGSPYTVATSLGLDEVVYLAVASTEESARRRVEPGRDLRTRRNAESCDRTLLSFQRPPRLITAGSPPKARRFNPSAVKKASPSEGPADHLRLSACLMRRLPPGWSEHGPSGPGKHSAPEREPSIPPKALETPLPKLQHGPVEPVRWEVQLAPVKGLPIELDA